MPITIRDVEKVASLAKLRLSEDEKKKYLKQLNDILSYVEKLNELDTSDIEPVSHVNEVMNVLREDKVTPSLPRNEALKNAPRRGDGFFKVPKVIK
ncbi:MAG: Asp-tRNA(Asn)/Glu-tRNA(Gln) amidotransferase subunit GatC [Fidelibacterota bacterium]